MKNYIKEITKDLEPGWIDRVIEIRDATIKHGQKHPNFKKVNKAASWASLEDCLMVYAMVRYYKPLSLLEIGTYIGTVTRVMERAGIDSDGIHPTIWTCDKNKVYEAEKKSHFMRIRYMNGLSSKVIRSMNKRQVSIDFCFIDGGLKPGDAKLLKKLYRDKIVFATHDYKPDQKGIRNIKAMKKVTKNPTIYKPTKQGIGYDVGLDYNLNSSVGVLIA